MGKKKHNAGKLPKKIAGVKIPKQARRQVKKAIAELKQPIVKEMIAGAMGMTETALARHATDRKAPDAAPAPYNFPKTRAEADSKATKSNGEQIAEIATGLAIAGLGKLFARLQEHKTKPPESA